jgi:hypothetical protein
MATAKPTKAVYKKGGTITNKQKKMADIYLNEPVTKTEAFIRSHPATKAKRTSIHTMAKQQFRKSSVISYLETSSELFESVITGTARDWKDSETPRKREIALDAAKFGHDKIFGKAKQTTEVNVQSTNITIDLTGGKYGAPPKELLDQSTD